MSGSEGRQSQEFLKIFKIFSQRSCKCQFHLNAISCHFRQHTSITLLFALQARQGFNRGRSKAIVLKTCSPRADGSVGNTYPSINPRPPPRFLYQICTNLRTQCFVCQKVGFPTIVGKLSCLHITIVPIRE